MPIRDRVQRFWRLVVDWWRPSFTDSPAPPTVPVPPSPAASSKKRPPGVDRATPAGSAGEPLITGAFTIRMWVVGGRLILATSPAEAERALLTLLPDLDADGQAEARRVLDQVRADQAQAA